MKRSFKFIILFSLVSLLLAVIAFGETVPFEEDYIKGDEIVVASFNDISSFVTDRKNMEPLEEACFWLSDFAETYNIKYASFLGNLTSGANFSYYNEGPGAGKTNANMMEKINGDTEWISEYLAIKSAGAILTDKDIAYGLSLGIKDYYSNGMYRDNQVDKNFFVDDFNANSDASYIESYDALNFATIVTSGKDSYIIFQLELFPRQAIIEWFNTTIQNHLDKRAFIFTTSFADATGEMYTQFDPMKYTRAKASELGILGNTTCGTNLVFIGNPFDGTSIWTHTAAKYDNVLMIMSSNAEPGKEIVTKSFTNNNGYEILSAVANLNKGYATVGAYPILIKFSEEEKTLDLRYAVPYYEGNGGYIKESVVQYKFPKLAPLPEPDPMSLLPKIPAQYNGYNTSYINGYAGNLFKPQANMTRAEASTIFARLLVGSTTLPTGNSTRFTDVKEGDWYYDAIAYLDTNNFYMNYDTETYTPNVPITRAEFVELAYFASDLYEKNEVKFKDVDESHKYYDAIMAGARAGLINGYEDNTFRPDATITRAEVVTIINRLLALVCTDETISEKSITNVFNDIEGHWAKNQILMASNSNVKSDALLNVDPTVFKESATAIEFGSDLFTVAVNKKNGKVQSIIYNATGENFLASSTTPWFTYANTRSGAALAPTKVEVVDGTLKFTYKGGYEAYFVIESFENYFSVELVSNVSQKLAGLTFGNLAFDYDSEYRAGGVCMDVKARMPHSPGGQKSTYASVHNDIPVDVMGAKLAIAFSESDIHRDILKEIVDDIDPERALTSKKGGPYTYDNPDIKGDYAIVYGVTADNVDEYIDAANTMSLDLLDLHQGANFVTGDFNFIGGRTTAEVEADKKSGKLTFIDGATYKERVSDKVHEAGLQLALHTYSASVGTQALTILQDPKWQKQLHYNATTYTLRGDMSKFRTNIKTYEDASTFKTKGGVPYDASPYFTSSYVLIDNEIIEIVGTTGTSSGFVRTRRGAFGTKPADHKDGAEIRVLTAKNGCFMPIVGSELFWHVADLTAKAYNEADFDMIYFDGLEGFTQFTPSADVNYYYYAEFVRRVLSQCEKDPMIEASAMGTNLWAAGGRIGAVDAASRGYKLHKEGHYQNYGKNSLKTYNTCTLGWFAFADGLGEYPNVSQRILFRDDIDFLGAISVESDFSSVVLGFTPESAKGNNTNYVNVRYYAAYKELRNGNYFSPEVKDALAKGEYEYRLVELDDGSYAFREMYYNKAKIHDLTDYATATGTNPFTSNEPYIRIEQRFSTDSQNPIVLRELDENADISKSVGSKQIVTVNLEKHMAMKVKVYGNGQDGAIVISLSNTSGTARSDYLVPTSHNGWKEFILVETDNGEYDGYSFSHINTIWSNWPTYGATLNRAAINNVQIATSGNVSGVKIDDIVAYPAVDAPVKNPTVTIGSTSITFDAELHSGDYLEYYPDLDKAYVTAFKNSYDEEGEYVSQEISTKEVSFNGSVTASAGTFKYSYKADALSDNPIRAKVVIGTQGSLIENPDDWDAPEVDLGNASLEVTLR